eukprot:814699-Prorocentrum_minimum.AAC.2
MIEAAKASNSPQFDLARISPAMSSGGGNRILPITNLVRKRADSKVETLVSMPTFYRNELEDRFCVRSLNNAHQFTKCDKSINQH